MKTDKSTIKVHSKEGQRNIRRELMDFSGNEEIEAGGFKVSQNLEYKDHSLLQEI
jgi:hypothetical protein